MPIIIKPEDVARIIVKLPNETSNARLYFSKVQNKNTTQLAVTDIQSTVGNIPVIKRGGKGYRPIMSAGIEYIQPQPIEIDDFFGPVEQDDYERSTGLGKQQIIDEKLNRWAKVITNTTKALCAQAHKGKIDYMMQAGPQLVRYQVEYGKLTKLTTTKTAANVKLGELVSIFEELAEIPSGNGIGGKYEYVAARNLFASIVELAAAQNKFDVTSGDGFIDFGGYHILRDNDTYKDVSTSGAESVKHMLDDNELMIRAVDAGQELDYLRLDDTVQHEAVPMYSFTTERDDHRGTNLYVKSKPFPLVNMKGIGLLTFAAA